MRILQNLLVIAFAAALSVSHVDGRDVEDWLFALSIVPLDGRVASGFVLENLQGKKTSLADFKGKVVLLYFWRTT
jgi:cytochrome oxidase Cu insertion factor (SCO1/SenC/PrrC family)